MNVALALIMESLCREETDLRCSVAQQPIADHPSYRSRLKANKIAICHSSTPSFAAVLRGVDNFQSLKDAPKLFVDIV
jgi:hypothetical protein